LSAASISAHGIRVSSVAVAGGFVYWLEGRPAEGGRNVLVERSPDGEVRDVTSLAVFTSSNDAAVTVAQEGVARLR
jgi:hypothetical protein